MFAHKNPEVLVVGAGPVGLFTALALVQRGVRVQIIEKEPSPSRALRDTKGLEALQRFDASRRVEWRGLLGLDGVLQALREADPWVAERQALLAECIPAAGADQLRLAGQIGLAHRRAAAITAR